MVKGVGNGGARDRVETIHLLTAGETYGGHCMTIEEQSVGADQKALVIFPPNKRTSSTKCCSVEELTVVDLLVYACGTTAGKATVYHLLIYACNRTARKAKLETVPIQLRLSGLGRITRFHQNPPSQPITRSIDPNKPAPTQPPKPAVFLGHHRLRCPIAEAECRPTKDTVQLSSGHLFATMCYKVPNTAVADARLPRVQPTTQHNTTLSPHNLQTFLLGHHALQVPHRRGRGLHLIHQFLHALPQLVL